MHAGADPSPKGSPFHPTPPSLVNTASLGAPTSQGISVGIQFANCFFVMLQRYYSFVAYFAQFLHSIPMSIYKKRREKRKKRFNGEEIIAACRELGVYSGAEAGSRLRKGAKTIAQRLV